MTDEELIIARERESLRRWAMGDPLGFVETAGSDITYFEPFLPRRVDGFEAFRNHYTSFAGTFHIDRFDLLNPAVQLYGDVGVLTFIFHSYTPDGRIESRWNSTEVYRNNGGQWNLVHSHWSMIQPNVPEPE